MERNYRTSHQGIAAYIETQGHDIVHAEPGTNKQGRRVTFFEFQLDHETGRRLGDDFFNDNVEGNIKTFYEALQNVRKKAWEARK
jgi:hypothetical protein